MHIYNSDWKIIILICVVKAIHRYSDLVYIISVSLFMLNSTWKFISSGQNTIRHTCVKNCIAIQDLGLSTSDQSFLCVCIDYLRAFVNDRKRQKFQNKKFVQIRPCFAWPLQLNAFHIQSAEGFSLPGTWANGAREQFYPMWSDFKEY